MKSYRNLTVIRKFLSNDLFASGDVTSGRSEALGEGPHEDVDVPRIEAEVVDDPATPRAHCSDLDVK
jgi:hypothetical protein